jgi:hypothetical protein
MIRAAINGAAAANFIRCVGRGKHSAAERAGISGLYGLRWVKDPARFQGFFEGEGNRVDTVAQLRREAEDSLRKQPGNRRGRGRLARSDGSIADLRGELGIQL